MSEEQAPGTGTGSNVAPPSTTTEPSADSPGRTPIRRSTQDRYIAGVCGGLGRATDVDPVIYRVVLGVLTLFGGIGLLYALGWLLIPAENEEQSEVQKLLWPRPILLRTPPHRRRDQHDPGHRIHHRRLRRRDSRHPRVRRARGRPQQAAPGWAPEHGADRGARPT